MDKPLLIAKLRAEASSELLLAEDIVVGIGPDSLFRAIANNRPKTALRMIERVEKHLKLAKRALRAWGGKRG